MLLHCMRASKLVPGCHICQEICRWNFVVYSEVHSRIKVRRNMSYTTTVILAIGACLLVAANADQSLDCRKLVYSRNCRGVAIKRGSLGNGETQSGIFPGNLSLRRLIYDLNLATDASLVEDISTPRRNEELKDNEVHKEKLSLDNFLEKLLMGKKVKNSDNYFPLYEY